MRKKSIIIAVIIFIIHQILDFGYRPYAYENNLFDFYLADSFTNFTAVIGLSALMVWKDSKKLYEDKITEQFIYIIPTLGMVAYEAIQLLMPNMVFSFSDIVYSLLGGFVAYIIKRFYYDKVKEEVAV